MWQKRCFLSVCIWFQEWAHLNPESTVPMYPQIPLFTLQLFLDFGEIFSPNGPSFFQSSRFNKYSAGTFTVSAGPLHELLQRSRYEKRTWHVFCNSSKNAFQAELETEGSHNLMNGTNNSKEGYRGRNPGINVTFLCLHEPQLSAMRCVVEAD